MTLDDVVNDFRRRELVKDEAQMRRVIQASDAYRALPAVTRSEASLPSTGFSPVDPGDAVPDGDPAAVLTLTLQGVQTATSYPATAFPDGHPSLPYILTMRATVSITPSVGASVGDTYSVTDQSTAPDGLALLWTFAGGPTALAFTPQPGFVATANIPAGPTVGFYRFTCTATLNGVSASADAIGYTSAAGPAIP